MYFLLLLTFFSKFPIVPHRSSMVLWHLMKPQNPTNYLVKLEPKNNSKKLFFSPNVSCLTRLYSVSPLSVPLRWFEYPAIYCHIRGCKEQGSATARCQRAGFFHVLRPGPEPGVSGPKFRFPGFGPDSGFWDEKFFRAGFRV